MQKRSCVAVSLTLLTPALLAGCARDCDPKRDPDCRSNGHGGYSRSYFGSHGFWGGSSSSGHGASGASVRGGFGAHGGGGHGGGGE